MVINSLIILGSLKHQQIEKVDTKIGIGVSLLQLVILFMDCFLMLLLMTYNLGVLCSIVAGQTIGYIFFTVNQEVIVCADDCHVPDHDTGLEG